MYTLCFEYYGEDMVIARHAVFILKAHERSLRTVHTCHLGPYGTRLKTQMLKPGFESLCSCMLAVVITAHSRDAS